MVPPIKKPVPRSAVQRIDDLEKNLSSVQSAIPAILSQVNNALNQLQGMILEQREIIDVLVEELGVEEVAKRMQDKREEELQEQADRAKAQVEAAVKNGDFRAVTEVSETSFVVGVERDLNGEVLKPGRLQLPAKDLIPEVRDQVIGKPVGTKVEVKDKGTFEVVEAYELVKKEDRPPVVEAEAPLEIVEPEAAEEGTAEDVGSLEDILTP